MAKTIVSTKRLACIMSAADLMVVSCDTLTGLHALCTQVDQLADMISTVFMVHSGSNLENFSHLNTSLIVTAAEMALVKFFNEASMPSVYVSLHCPLWNCASLGADAICCIKPCISERFPLALLYMPNSSARRALSCWSFRRMQCSYV
jgi:hypothetical protein